MRAVSTPVSTIFLQVCPHSVALQTRVYSRGGDEMPKMRGWPQVNFTEAMSLPRLHSYQCCKPCLVDSRVLQMHADHLYLSQGTLRKGWSMASARPRTGHRNGRSMVSAYMHTKCQAHIYNTMLINTPSAAANYNVQAAPGVGKPGSSFLSPSM